jgi:hypothetical protein
MTRREKSEEWRRERMGELAAEIQCERAILASLIHEYDQLERLQGPELLARFGWEKPAEVERTMQSQKEFLGRVKEMFVEAVLQGTW